MRKRNGQHATSDHTRRSRNRGRRKPGGAKSLVVSHTASGTCGQLADRLISWKKMTTRAQPGQGDVKRAAPLRASKPQRLLRSTANTPPIRKPFPWSKSGGEVVAVQTARHRTGRPPSDTRAGKIERGNGCNRTEGRVRMQRFRHGAAHGSPGRSLPCRTQPRSFVSHPTQRSWPHAPPPWRGSPSSQPSNRGWPRSHSPRRGNAGNRPKPVLLAAGILGKDPCRMIGQTM